MDQKLSRKIQETRPPPDKLRFEEKLFDQSPDPQFMEEDADVPRPFPNIVLFRSALNDLPLFAVWLFIGSVAVGAAFLLRNSIGRLSGHELFFMLALVLAAGFGVLCVVAVFRRYNVRYLIADDGIEALRGILSNNQVDAKLEYYQIRGTEIHRSLFERLIGTGDLHVRGSTSNDTEVAFKGIRDPYRCQQLIQGRHRLAVQDSKAAWSNHSGGETRHEIPSPFVQ